MRISATIITFNEERNIARAMESLRCCDEIIVVDSHSTDRTRKLPHGSVAASSRALGPDMPNRKIWRPSMLGMSGYCPLMPTKP